MTENVFDVGQMVTRLAKPYADDPQGFNNLILNTPMGDLLTHVLRQVCETQPDLLMNAILQTKEIDGLYLLMTHKHPHRFYINAFCRGADLEVYDPVSRSWGEIDHDPTFDHKLCYRVVGAPTINEKYLSMAYNWLAVDKDNSAYVFTERPGRIDGRWVVGKNGSAMRVDNCIKSYTRGTCNWQDSLVKLNHDK